jgi:hypothetical protein
MLLPCGDQMGRRDITVLVELLGFVTAHAVEIGKALNAVNNLEVRTGYDPVAVRRETPLKESHEE